MRRNRTDALAVLRLGTAAKWLSQGLGYEVSSLREKNNPGNCLQFDCLRNSIGLKLSSDADSGPCTLMIRWYLSRLLHYFSDWLWPYSKLASYAIT